MTIGTKDMSVSPYRVYRKWWSGSDSPNPSVFHEENPYSMECYDSMCGGLGRYAPTHWAEYQPSQLVNTIVHPSVYTRWNSLELKALNRAVSALKDHDFSIAVTLGEGRETVGMLAGTLHKIYGGLKAAKKGNLQQAARLLGGNEKGLPTKTRRPLDGQDLASFYLGMRYGWVPALSDSYNAVEAYRQKLHTDGKKTYGAGRAKNTRHYNGHPITYSIGEAYVTPASCVDSVNVKLILNQELDLPRYLGLNNPFTVAWELLPLSFVFDWALPVGDYLSMLNAVPREGTTVIVSKRTLIRALGGPVATNLVPVGYKKPKYIDGDQWLRYRYVKLTRTVQTWSEYSIPIPELTPPGDLFGWKRVLDVAALAKSLFFNEKELGPVRSNVERTIQSTKRRGGASRKWSAIYR